MRNKMWGFVVLAVVSVMAAAGTGAQAQEPTAPTEKTGGEAVGATVVHPAGWNVEREPYTYDDTFGYTLWYPDTDAAHDHGGRPALRVALAYELNPEDIEAEVDGVLADYPDLPLKRETVDVAREHEGVAVGTIPGSTPYTAVYVPVNGRVYEVDVYARDTADEGIDAEDRRLLSGVRFEPPSTPVGSLDLPAANSPEVLYPSGSEAREIADNQDAKVPEGVSYPTGNEPTGNEPAATSARATAKGGGEQRIAEGCWRADPGFFVQTQHGFKANSSGGDGIPTGWTQIGLPNFWGQYTHGNLGYGRCSEPNWANDKYAVDYPLDRGDFVFSPFKCGTVTFVGRNQSHADYGIFVSIRACNGKYVNLSAHLSSVSNGLGRGDRVTEKTVIGYAGDTGGGNIAVGRVHLHTAFYRYPKMTPDGGPYGGAGLQVDRNRYVGTAARRKEVKVDSHVYRYDKVSPKDAFCREDRRCGERYLVSN